MKVKSLGYELEVSKHRNSRIFYPRNYYTCYHSESSSIMEFNLKKVKFVNERNTVRRFMVNLLTGAYCEGDYNLNFRGIPLNPTKNFKGSYTRKGESGHFHIKIDTTGYSTSASFINSLEREKFPHFLVLMSPFLSRRQTFRDTIRNRAYVTLSEIYIDTKSKFLCYNTGPYTLEIRLNESLVFPVVVALLTEAFLSSGEMRRFVNSVNFEISDLVSQINNRRRITKEWRNKLKPVLSDAIDFAISYFSRDDVKSELSANGEYYRDMLEIVKDNLSRKFVNAPLRFELACAEQFLESLYVRSRRFREIVNNIYIPIANGGPARQIEGVRVVYID
jgi:hypothetical protein